MKSTFGLVCEGFAMHGNLEVCQLGSGDGAVVEEQAGAKTTAESEAGLSGRGGQEMGGG